MYVCVQYTVDSLLGFLLDNDDNLLVLLNNVASSLCIICNTVNVVVLQFCFAGIAFGLHVMTSLSCLVVLTFSVV